jgi:hypothetical protein
LTSLKRVVDDSGNWWCVCCGGHGNSLPHQTIQDRREFQDRELRAKWLIPSLSFLLVNKLTTMIPNHEINHSDNLSWSNKQLFITNSSILKDGPFWPNLGHILADPVF